MSRLPRFLAVHIYRGHAITNFDGVFEQLPPVAKTRWPRVDIKALGGRGHRQSGWLRLR